MIGTKKNTTALDRLLLEAASVVANAGSSVFRNAAAKEAGSLFLPGPPECAAGKSLAARALRETIKALATATDPDARKQIASAITCLASAVRSEPEAAPPLQRIGASEPRRYWLEKN